MRVPSSEVVGRWAQGAGLLALGVLAWGVFVRDDLFWAGIVAAGAIGSVTATAILVRSRSIPTLAEVIAHAEAEPAVVPVAGGSTGGARLRSRGGRT
jgi:hypothetical protein